MFSRITTRITFLQRSTQLGKMVDGVFPSCVSTHTFTKNNGNMNECVCTKCSVYEFQLKEALDELGSARMIIDILRKRATLIVNYIEHPRQ
jgi:hypothetical protein